MTANVTKKITVIMPVYQAAAYLNQAVESVLKQTFADFILLLIDDGSTDGSDEICDTYASQDQRVQVLHVKHQGVAVSRNLGLQHAVTPYVTFVDADDYVQQNYLEVLYQTLINSQAEMSVCSTEIIYLNGSSQIRASYQKMVATPHDVLRMILIDDDPIVIACYAKLYKRELFNCLEFPVGHISEDVAIMYKLIERCQKIACYLEPLYVYCLHQNSLTQQREFSPDKMDDFIFHQQMCDYVADKYIDLQPLCENRMVRICLAVLRRLAFSRQIDAVVKKQLWDYLRLHRSKVLKRRALTWRERVMLHTSYWGFGWFKFVQKTYRKLKHLFCFVKSEKRY